MAIASGGWCKHCQAIEHNSERCPLVPAYSNSMETSSQGRIKSQRRPGAALVPLQKSELRWHTRMTTALSLIISKVTTSLRKPVVFHTSAVHAKGHTPSASVTGCEMQSQRFQSELGIIQTACSQKLVASVVLISDFHVCHHFTQPLLFLITAHLLPLSLFYSLSFGLINTGC